MSDAESYFETRAEKRASPGTKWERENWGDAERETFEAWVRTRERMRAAGKPIPSMTALLDYLKTKHGRTLNHKTAKLYIERVLEVDPDVV